MPRYFFHFRDQESRHEDTEGMTLPNLQAALAELRRVDQELTAAPSGLHDLVFEVTDEDGRLLLRVPVQRSSSLPLAERQAEWRGVRGRRLLQ